MLSLFDAILRVLDGGGPAKFFVAEMRRRQFLPAGPAVLRAVERFEFLALLLGLLQQSAFRRQFILDLLERCPRRFVFRLQAVLVAPQIFPTKPGSSFVFLSLRHSSPRVAQLA